MEGVSHPSHQAGWTDDRVATLKKMWRDGASASEIATALGGGVTRNGVIGKVDRLKLVRRKETSTRAAKAVGGRGSAGKHRGAVDSARKARTTNAGGLAFKIARARQEQPEATSMVEVMASMREGDPAGQKLLRSKAWEAIPGAEPITLLRTNEHTCKWPIGDAPILFCGLHSGSGSPYCEQHRALSVVRK